jgi:nucleotide-binding universal stress UspA family protein
MRILLVVDDSEASADGIETVADQPRPPGTMVRVLSVAEPVPAELHSRHDTLEQAQQEMTKNAESLTARVTDVLRAKGLAADGAVGFGDPASQIVNEAREWSADLIVLGADTYRSERRETDTVARSVVNHAPCRVEVVEAGESTVERRIHGK